MNKILLLISIVLLNISCVPSKSKLYKKTYTVNESLATKSIFLGGFKYKIVFKSSYWNEDYDTSRISLFYTPSSLDIYLVDSLLEKKDTLLCVRQYLGFCDNEGRKKMFVNCYRAGLEFYSSFNFKEHAGDSIHPQVIIDMDKRCIEQLEYYNKSKYDTIGFALPIEYVPIRRYFRRTDKYGNLFEFYIKSFNRSLVSLFLIQGKGDTLVVPSSVECVGRKFVVDEIYRCQGLFRHLIIPSTIREIGKVSFAGNECLESVVIEDGVEVIKERAFADCIKLQTIILPSSVKSISNNAFIETPWWNTNQKYKSLINQDSASNETDFFKYNEDYMSGMDWGWKK